MPTRSETLEKYGSEKLCNDKFDFENGTFYQCQLFKDKTHSWHIEKGLCQNYTVAWKTKKEGD